MTVLLMMGCGGGGTTTFSRAHITVDPNKQMSALSADERASVCAEFSRALTASFDSRAVGCKFHSLGGPQSQRPTCGSDYETCLTMPEPTDMISGCTNKMQDMWMCSITIGQYQDCFNDINSQLLQLVEVTPACMPNATTPPPTPASCIAAPCDYVWFD